MGRLFLSILILLLCNSCALYNTINFEVLSPSELTIPSDVKTIAFVYRNTQTREDTTHLNKSKTNKQEKKAFEELVKICYTGFSDIIIPTERYDSVYFYKMKPEIIEDRTKTPLLSWDTINSICSKLGADVLVVLENSNFKVKKEIHGTFDQPDIRNNISWNFTFNTYDPLYSKLLDHKAYKDSVVMADYLTFEQFNNPLDFELERLSYSIGELYAMRINPYWRNISRRIYNTGNKILSAGYFYFNQTEHKTAISVWKKLVNDKNPRLASKACINIATAYEMMGIIEEAKKYAALSLFYYNKYKAKPQEIKYANTYIKDLQKRIIEQDILDKQF